MKHLKGNGLAEDHSTSNNQTKFSTLSRDRLKGWKKRNDFFYSPSLHPKLVWLSLFRGTLKEIFWRKYPFSTGFCPFFEPFHSISTAGKGVLGWKDRFNRGCLAIRSSSRFATGSSSHGSSSRTRNQGTDHLQERNQDFKWLQSGPHTKAIVWLQKTRHNAN